MKSSINKTMNKIRGEYKITTSIDKFNRVIMKCNQISKVSVVCSSNYAIKYSKYWNSQEYFAWCLALAWFKVCIQTYCFGSHITTSSSIIKLTRP